MTCRFLPSNSIYWKDSAMCWRLDGAFLLPLTIGMVSRAVAPAPSERFAGYASGVAGVGLAVASLALLVTHLQFLAAVHWQGMMALIGTMVIGLAIGHILGGPDPDERTALAIACVTRHVGVAVVVATSFRGPRTAVMLAARLFPFYGIGFHRIFAMASPQSTCAWRVGIALVRFPVNLLSIGVTAAK
jgi:predicted Na+-dependent transporter